MKVCFVGIGSIAKRHIKNLSEICIEKGTALQIDALRHETGKNDAEGITNTYTNPIELPNDYDAIFITNPTEYHAEMIIKLQDKARNFFVEKPVTSLESVKILDDFNYNPETAYYVACPLRYNSVIQYIKGNINLDSVMSVRSISSSYLPDWRPGIDYRNTYSAKRMLGGGVGIDLIHEWDYLSYLFGFPEEIKSFSGKISNLEIDSDDYAVYIAKYKRMVTELHLDYFGRKAVRRIELFTEDDTIIGDLISEKILFLKSGKTITFNEKRDDYQKRELNHFIDVAERKIPSDNNIEHSIAVLKLARGEL